MKEEPVMNTTWTGLFAFLLIGVPEMSTANLIPLSAHTKNQNHASQSLGLFAKATNIRRQTRAKRKAKSALKPEYKHCQGTDLSSLRFPQKSYEETEGGLCFNCPNPEMAEDFKALKQANEAIQLKEFREQLRKRILGQVSAKLFKIRHLRACFEKDREKIRYPFDLQANTYKGRTTSPLSKKFVDWPLIQAHCQNQKKALRKSIQSQMPQMRVNLALSSVNADYIVRGQPDFSFPLSHTVSDFASIPKLTDEEQRIAKEHLAKFMENTKLEGYSQEEFKSRFLKSQDLKKLTEKDQARLKQTIYEGQKTAQAHYFQAIEEPISNTPLLGYLKSPNPDDKEIGSALKKIETHLKKALKEVRHPERDLNGRIEDPEKDMAFLLSFKPLVEELLKEEKHFCFVAEKARIQAKKNEKFEQYSSIAMGILAAGACVITGPVGATVCLTSGVGLGVYGYKQAKAERDITLKQVLIGKEFETIGGLEERERELFLAKLFLPLSAYGTTAVPARALGGAIAKTFRTKMSQEGKNEPVENPLANQTNGQKINKQIEPTAQKPTEKIPSDLVLRAKSRKETKAFKQAWRVPMGSENSRYYTKAQLEEVKELLKGLSEDAIQSFMAEKFTAQTNRLPHTIITRESLVRFMNQHEKGGGKFDRNFTIALAEALKEKQYVIKHSNLADLYHGSKSRSLLAFTKYKKHGLKGLGGNLSTVKITDLEVADLYSQDKGWRNNPISPEGTMLTENRLDVNPLLNAVRPNMHSAMDKLSKAEKLLVKEDFPIIYGLKPKAERTIKPEDPDWTLIGEPHTLSSRPGVDVVMVGGADLDEIVSIFVPYDKVHMVQEIVKKQGLPITVSPIEPIQKPPLRMSEQISLFEKQDNDE